MKKTAAWLMAISLIVFVIFWGIVGLKILDHDDDFVTEPILPAVHWRSFFLLSSTFEWQSDAPIVEK